MERRKNSGFSLIELIVVVAIMGVMIGVVSFSIGLIHSTNVKKCAQSIKTGIDATRVNCMSKANASKITVCVEDDVIKLKKHYPEVEAVADEETESGQAASDVLE